MTQSAIDPRSHVIHGEDPTVLAGLIARFFADFQPATASECALVDILIDSDWRLRRVRKTETELWDHHMHDFLRWDSSICALRDSVQRTFQQTLRQLLRIQADRS